MEDEGRSVLRPAGLNIGIGIAVILGGLALYFVPLQSTAFYFDDHFSVENNDAIKRIDVPAIFENFNTRFLVGLSFALNYKIAGLHPSAFRLVNLLIHCLNAFLVFLLIRSMRPDHYPSPAFFGALLFLYHPIQTEPVNFITQRFVLMGTFFYLSTLFFYIQYRCRFKKRYFAAAVLSAVAAMLCKEFTVTVALMLALYEFYFLGPPDEGVWKRCGRLAPFFAVVLIVPVLLLRTPHNVTDVANIADSGAIQEDDSLRGGNRIDITRANGAMGRKQYFLTELNVVCTYVRLLLLPVRQNFDYDYPITYQMDLKTALCGLFLLCLLGIAVMTYRSYRLVSFGILWFFIALSVESSFIPIGHVIAEYRLYLASVGFVFLVTALIYTRRVDVKTSNLIATAIVIVLSVLTWQRNNVWKDELSLWNDTVQKSPHKARAYNNRGSAYYQRNDIVHAISDYSKAIELYPYYAQAYDNRGGVYYKEGRLARALSDYSMAIEIDPKYADAYDNRGVIYYKQGKIARALADLNQAIELDPRLAGAYDNRGNIYYSQGNLGTAMSDYNRAIELNPTLGEAYNNRGTAYVMQGDLGSAISDYNKAIETRPDYAGAYDNRANVYYKQGRLAEALSDYDQAIKIDPQDAMAYENRGTVYEAQGRLSQALMDYNKVIEINPGLGPAYKYRGLVYYKQGHYSQALSEYDKAIAINPHDAEVYNDLGSVYGSEGRVSEALFNFDKAIEINPRYADAYDNRAVAYYSQKEYDRAWADVRRVRELGSSVNPAFIDDLKKASANAQ